MNFLDKIFHLDIKGQPPWKYNLLRLAQFLAGVVTEFNKDKCMIRASGLSYALLLALVPLTTLTFALFSAFSAFEKSKEKVQNFIFSQILPTSQDEIIAYIDQFTSNASKLGMVSVIFFALTAVMLLDNIEKNFNEIWAVSRKRKFFNKMTSYTTFLLFGSLLIGASFSITAKIKSALKLDGILEVGFFSKVSLWLFPLGLSFLAFLLMYYAIPFTKVKFKSAAIGAFIGSAMWEIGKNAFSHSVGSSVKYSAIYGSIALIPIFLVWLYITWMIVLIGLEITYTHQNFNALISNRIFRNPSGIQRLGLALKFFTFIATSFHKGEVPPKMDDLAGRFETPIEVAGTYVDLLMERNLVHEITSSGDGYVPSQSLDKITVKDVINAVFIDVENRKTSRETLDQTIENSLTSFQQAGNGAIGNDTFLEYLKKIET